MKQIKFILLTIMILSWGAVSAQNRSIKGVVLTEGTNDPVIGASIIVKGTSVGTITDVYGNFSIANVPESAKQIEVSYVGMITQNLAIQFNPYKILLEEDTHLLDEIVVQGAYGAQTKASVTGAISSIDAKKIEQRPISSVSSVLEGASSGIQVNSSYGEPGASADIRIRGFSSINGVNSPLFVLDGVPYQGSIADINPNDIESLSVLKDAASAALFGNKAANGVILITTKKGKGDRINFNVNINQGIYERGIKEYERMGTKEWMETMRLGYKNYLTQKYSENEANRLASENLIDVVGYNIFNKPNNGLFDENGKMVSDAQIRPGYKGDLDWYKPLERYGHRQEYNMSGSGASNKADYYMSVNYLDEKGYIKSSDFQRLTARGNVNLAVKPWFKTGINLSASHQNKNVTTGDTGSSNAFANPFNFARYMAPIYPVHLHDPATGEYVLDKHGDKIYDSGGANGRPQNNGRHIIWESLLNSDKIIRNTINSQLYGEFKFLKDFTFTLKGSMYLSNAENQRYDNAIIGDGKGLGRSSRTITKRKEYTFQQHLDWNRLFAEKHHVNILVGHESYKDIYTYLYGFKTNQVFSDNIWLNNFTQVNSLYDYQTDYRTESYLSRIRYNYAERYYGEFSFRRDGSSKFYKDNRWGNFWSVGGSWMISKEEFMQSLLPVINDLKLRISYGEVGNDASIGRYGYRELYTISQNNNLGASYLSQNPNMGLKWEKTQSIGIALEGRVYDRVNFSLEYFDKRSKDLLFDVNLPLSSGGTSGSNLEAIVSRNIGTVSNRGFEINADVDIIKTKDWRWNLGMNGTYIKNKIIKLPEENRENGIISGTKKFVEGGGVYDYWLYQYVGVDQMNGRALYKIDSDKYYVDPANKAPGKTAIGGNGTVINGQEYTYKTTYGVRDWSGSAMPKWYGSFNTSVTWKDLTLSTLITYGVGNKILDYNYMSLMGVTSNPSAIHRDVAKSWNGTPEGMTKDSENRIWYNGTPRVDYATSNDVNTTSDRFLINGNYVTIKNINVSYTIPRDIIKKIDFSRLSVNMSVENVHTFTAKRGMTPTQSYSGTNQNAFVPARILSFGLNLQF